MVRDLTGEALQPDREAPEPSKDVRTKDKARQADNKRAQRKRRKAGVEKVSAPVYMPKFIAWLIWEGHLDPQALKLRPKERNAEVSKALERFLWRCYSPFADRSPQSKQIVVDWPGYANGSLARDFTALRDKPDPEASWPNPIAGVLEREEQTWHEALKPTSYLITRRNAPLRRAFPPAVADAPDAELTSYCGEPSTYDVATENPWYRGDEYDDPQADADYDPETDMEEESLDIHEEAIAACFDDGGYEQE